TFWSRSLRSPLQTPQSPTRTGRKATRPFRPGRGEPSGEHPMPAPPPPPYNSRMTTTSTLASAEALLDALAAHDFEGIATAFEPDATLRALLPRGYDEWQGTADIRLAFEQ